MRLDEELRDAKLRADRAPVEIAQILVKLRTYEDRESVLKSLLYILKADYIRPGILERYTRGELP